jgi:5-(carboxyamino)imidazole ribonucleotide synthase
MAQPNEPIQAHAVPQTLGVLGGGQLGRMFVHAAQRMGFFTAVLDPDPHSPAGRVSHHHICTEYTDPAGLTRLAELAMAVTTEFENVPAAALTELARHRPVAPGAAAVAIAQDRAAEKAYFAQCGVPCAPYAVVDTEAQLAAVADGLLPGILKTSCMGYDGKGQVRVRDRAELERAWHGLRGVPCVLEQLLPLQAECSVIVARGRDGTCVHLPIQRNLHRDGILAVTEVYEGNLPSALAARAVAAAQSIAQGLDYVGVLCVEFFVLDAQQAQGLGDLVVNEIAPRPHNSGHYSIDACDLSQFELQVRSLAGLPLVQPTLHSPAVMLNLLGDLWHGAHGGVQGTANEGTPAGAPAGAQATAQEPPWAQVLALPGSHLHLYGKTEAKLGRKMGHLTLTGASPEQARERANAAARLLGLPTL